MGCLAIPLSLHRYLTAHSVVFDKPARRLACFRVALWTLSLRSSPTLSLPVPSVDQMSLSATIGGTP